MTQSRGRGDFHFTLLLGSSWEHILVHGLVSKPLSHQTGHGVGTNQNNPRLSPLRNKRGPILKNRG